MNEPNKYKIVDLFSGAGGLELGFEQAGYDVVFSTDFDENCEEVHLTNRPNIPFLRIDIHDLDEKLLNVVQAVCLIILLIVVLINVNTKHKTLKIRNKALIFLVGLVLGTISSFLSIGGGPINVAVFNFFFSFDMKLSAVYSIATIIFAQGSKLMTIILNHGFSGLDIRLLFCIIPMAIFGGITGTKMNKSSSEKTIKFIFNCTVTFIILLNVYNAINLMK